MENIVVFERDESVYHFECEIYSSDVVINDRLFGSVAALILFKSLLCIILGFFFFFLGSFEQ